MPQLGLGSSLSRGGVLSGFTNTYSLDFDGTDDHLLIAATNDLSFGDGSNDSAFTVAAWVYIDDATAFRIVSKDGGVVGSKREYEFMTETSDDNLYMYLRDEDPGKWAYVKTDATITSLEGSWAHLAATYDGGGGATAADGLAIYVNGSSVAVTATNNAAYVAMENDGGDFYIGRKTNYYANGKFDEVAVWGAELSSGSISNIYNSGTPTDLLADSNSGNLVGWWRMGDGDLDHRQTNGLVADQSLPSALGGDIASSLGWNNTDSPYETFTHSGNVVSEAINTGWGIVHTDDFSLTSGNVYQVRYNLTLVSGVVPDFAKVSRNTSLDAGTEFSEVPVNGINTHYFICSDSQSDFKFGFRINGTTSWSLSDLTIKPVTGNAGVLVNFDGSDFKEDVPPS
jgi:hypothetical protein